MSKPVQTAEIEDVLSSIRRLVSEEPKPRPVEPAPAETLVLTPSQRVEELAQEAFAEEDSAAEPEVGADNDADIAAEDPGAIDAVFALDRAHRIEDAEVLDAVADGCLSDDEPNDEIPAEVLVGSSDIASGPEPLDDSGAENTIIFEQQADENAGKALDAMPDIAEKDVSEDEPSVETATSEVESIHVDEPMEEVVAQFIHHTDDRDDAATWQDVPFEDRVAELEGVVAESGETWEPDGTGQGEDEKTVSEFPGASSSFSDGGASTQSDYGSDDFSDGQDDETFLDEDMLRDLVNEIVREELNGTLGRRITRNVRKLVRQEINRALAAREFD